MIEVDERILKRVWQKVPKCPFEVVRDAYISQVRNWCGQTRWLRRLMNATLEVNVSVYSLGSDPFVEIVDVPIGSFFQPTVNGTTPGQWYPIVPSNPTNFSPNTAAAQPQNYAYLPEGTIQFWPPPSLAFPVMLTLAVQPTESTTQLDNALFNKHWKAFEAGALAHLYMLAEAWANPALGKQNAVEFQASINNAKADVARGYQSGTVIGRSRSFVV